MRTEEDRKGYQEQEKGINYMGYLERIRYFE